MDQKPPDVPADRRRCQHLRSDVLPKHADLTFRSVPFGENTTTYHWDLRLELCVLCSGFMTAKICEFMAGDPVSAELVE